MAEENIQIIVHDDGRIEFRTHDIKGEACMEELEEILGELVDDLKCKNNSEYHEPPSQRKPIPNKKATENEERFKMSASYVQLGMPITQIHCLDEAIKACGGTWNRPEILIQIEKARNNLEIAKDTSELIRANQELARLLEELASSEPLNSITFKVDGVQVTLQRNHGRYSTSLRSTDQRLSQIQTIMSKIQSKYQLVFSNLQSELTATLQRLEEIERLEAEQKAVQERLKKLKKGD